MKTDVIIIGAGTTRLPYYPRLPYYREKRGYYQSVKGSGLSGSDFRDLQAK